jgi:hypothetical protein
MRSLFYFIRRYYKKIRNIRISEVPLFIYAILTILMFVLYLRGTIPLLTLNGALATLAVLAISTIRQKQEANKQTALISFTAKYLLEKEESYIDEIFGLLISGRFKEVKIDAINEFFECIKKLCLTSDFEMRRRASEALPALFHIRLNKGKEIFEVLRKDWHERWKADNRRRAIEGLVSAIILDDDYVIENIHTIDNDQIFTVIALVEVLGAVGSQIGWNKADKIYENLKSEIIERKFSSNEILAINELWDLLKLIGKKLKLGIARCETLKDSENECIQICVARNLKFFYKKYPERTIELMEFFIHKDRPKNVRRPIAKDDSVECLMCLCEDRKCILRAQDIIWQLMTDDDDIIRLAAFDKIEKILVTNKDFGRKVLNHIIKKNHNTKLVERAKILLQRA